MDRPEFNETFEVVGLELGLPAPEEAMLNKLWPALKALEGMIGREINATLLKIIIRSLFSLERAAKEEGIDLVSFFQGNK